MRATDIQQDSLFSYSKVSGNYGITVTLYQLPKT